MLEAWVAGVTAVTEPVVVIKKVRLAAGHAKQNVCTTAARNERRAIATNARMPKASGSQQSRLDLRK